MFRDDFQKINEVGKTEVALVKSERNRNTGKKANNTTQLTDKWQLIRWIENATGGSVTHEQSKLII